MTSRFFPTPATPPPLLIKYGVGHLLSSNFPYSSFRYEDVLSLISWKQNLCTAAAYRPVRELIQQERLKDKVNKQHFVFRKYILQRLDDN